MRTLGRHTFGRLFLPLLLLAGMAWVSSSHAAAEGAAVRKPHGLKVFPTRLPQGDVCLHSKVEVGFLVLDTVTLTPVPGADVKLRVPSEAMTYMGRSDTHGLYTETVDVEHFAPLKITATATKAAYRASAPVDLSTSVILCDKWKVQMEFAERYKVQAEGSELVIGARQRWQGVMSIEAGAETSGPVQVSTGLLPGSYFAFVENPGIGPIQAQLNPVIAGQFTMEVTGTLQDGILRLTFKTYPIKYPADVHLGFYDVNSWYEITAGAPVVMKAGDGACIEGAGMANPTIPASGGMTHTFQGPACFFGYRTQDSYLAAVGAWPVRAY